MHIRPYAIPLLFWQEIKDSTRSYLYILFMIAPYLISHEALNQPRIGQREREQVFIYDRNESYNFTSPMRLSDL